MSVRRRPVPNRLERGQREVRQWSEWALAGDLIKQRNGFGSSLCRLDSDPGQINDPGGECAERGGGIRALIFGGRGRQNEMRGGGTCRTRRPSKRLLRTWGSQGQFLPEAEAWVCGGVGVGGGGSLC